MKGKEIPQITRWWKNDYKLKPQQEEFAKLYIDHSIDLFGNGTQCYLEVYDIDRSKPNRYKTARSAASRLLTNVNVINRINALLEEGGLNDQFVDRQLLFLIQQHDDFSSKMAAIKEYNKVKQRITNKIEHSWEIAWVVMLPPRE